MLKTTNERKNNNVPLRIGIDGRVLQDPQPSGIPSYAKNIIENFLKIDKKNKYIIFYNSFRNIKGEIPKFEGDIEEKIFRYPNKFLEWFWKIIPYPKIDKILNVDIFFSPHFINIPLSNKVKKVVTVHDLSFIKNKKYFSLRKNIWHWQMNPQKACSNFDKIIAVSENTKNDIVNTYKIKKEKIKVIYNGSRPIYDDIDFEKEKNFLKKFGLEKNKYLLFLATLEPRKNICGLIDAYAKIYKKSEDFKLVIAGKKGWLFKNIFEKVLKHNLNDKIIFTDFINEEEKHLLYKNAFCFVFPSFCEGFGLPLAEAKNYQLPIITSATSSIPEIAKDGAILVNPHNTEELAVAIIKTIQNQNLRNAFKNKLINSHRFSWETSAYETLQYILS